MIRTRHIRPCSTIDEASSHNGATVRKSLSVAISLALCWSNATAEVPVLDNATGATVDAAVANAMGGQNLNINQSVDRAVLEWQSFNIGANDAVNFSQPSSSAIALNRVLGAAPSQIYGDLTANGRVFLLNHNGVLIGNGASVNTRGFLASTLDIDDETLYRGIEKNIVTNGTDFDVLPALVADMSRGAMGNIEIEEGASIEVGRGDSIMLFGPSVTNNGTLYTAEGQVIMAAAEDEVFLGTAGSNDFDTRGIVVGLKTGGDVTNAGTIIAERGNVSLLGLSVNQSGLVRATTSISLNGSIVLRSEDNSTGVSEVNATADDENTVTIGFGVNAGDVTLGDGSQTIIEAESESDRLALLDRVEQSVIKASGDTRPDESDLDNLIEQLYDDADNLEAIVNDTNSLIETVEAAGISVDRDEFAGFVAEDVVLTAPDALEQSVSVVDIDGRVITFESGSEVDVTGGLVSIEAFRSHVDNGSTGAISLDSTTQVDIQDGARIDVSGDTSSVVSVGRNFVKVDAFSNELADSPLQRDGVLRGQTLTVDIRDDVEIIDISGAVASVERTVNERLGLGGEVSIRTRGSVNIADGAEIDISGGSVTYTGDDVSVSLLITASGEYVDIADASRDQVYTGVLGEIEVTDPKWGVTRVWGSGATYFEEGYVQGYDAGSLFIESPGVSLGDGVIADTTAGIYQREQTQDLASTVTDFRPFDAINRGFTQLAQGGRLQINQVNSSLRDVVIGEDDGPIAMLQNHPDAVDGTLVISPELLQSSGISRVEINNGGRIVINRELDLQPFFELDLLGTQVISTAQINAPGGDIRMEASPYLQRSHPDNELGPLVGQSGTLGAQFGSPLSIESETSLVHVDAPVLVSGRWQNDSNIVNTDGLADAPIVRDGGDIYLASARNLTVTADSELNTGGGAHYSRDGDLTAGSGGDISLLSALEDDRASVFDVRAELSAFGLQRGGKLTIQGEQIEISDFPALSPDAEYALDPASQITQTGGLLQINSDITQLGGFSSYEFIGAREGLAVVDSTRIDLISANLLIDTESENAPYNSFTPTVPGAGASDPLAFIPNTVTMDELTVVTRLPEQLRSPVDLKLVSKADMTDDNPLYIGTGAVIQAENNATVDLVGGIGLEMYGEVYAPSGDIRLSLSGNADNGDEPVDAGYLDSSLIYRIWLGETARLVADGAVVFDLEQSFPGLQFGEVLDAGSVSISTPYGSIVTTPGSLISVDAVSETLAFNDIRGLQQQVVGGDAGSISLQAAETILAFGELSGQRAAGQRAGELSVTLDPSQRFNRSPITSFDVVNNIGERFYFGEYTLAFGDISYADIDGVITQDSELPTAFVGRGYVPVSQFDEGGLESLNVVVRSTSSSTRPDTDDSLTIIEFENDLDLVAEQGITLDAAVLRSEADIDVSLQSSYVELGSQFDGYRLDGSVYSASIERDMVTGDPVEYVSNILVTPPITSFNYNQNISDVITLESSAGDASINVTADVIDIVGELVYDGFGQTGTRTASATGLSGDAGTRLSGDAGIRFDASDLRLIGVRENLVQNSEYTGLLLASSDIIIDAQRIYPTTLTDFTIEVAGAAGSIEFTDTTRNSSSAPLTLGGTLTVTADLIEQDSNVYAPLGSLDFVAQDTLYLTTDSLMASSAADVNAPFFTTESSGGSESGFNLVIESGSRDIVFVEAAENLALFERLLPSQALSLTADSILVAEGARFDLRSGTDSTSIQFQPGPGGSTDILLSENAGSSFAILPGISEFAPYDPQLTPELESQQGYSIGETLVLEEGIAGLPAGEYAILPPRYALYGGYLVTPQSGTEGLSPGQGLSFSDGSVVLSGRFGIPGTDGVETRSQGFEIADADVILNRAEYVQTPLADLYSTASLRSTDDAGVLNIEAISQLELNGQLVNSDVVLGRGSEVNISASALSIVTDDSLATGITVAASQLEQLGADSILIGGRRDVSANGQIIEALADTITVEDGVSVDVNELLLLADTVDVQSVSGGTTLSSSSDFNGRTETLVIADDAGSGINGDAALVAVSNQAITIQRSSTTGATGNLSIDDGALLSASGSIVADAAGTVTLDGDVTASGDSARIVLGANSVSLGETDGQVTPPGITLSNAALTSLDGNRLVLRSDSSVNIYGELTNTNDNSVLEFSELDIDAQSLTAISTGAAVTPTLSAASVKLRNTSASVAIAGSTDSGNSLIISSDTVLLGEGAVLIDEFSNVSIDASRGLLMTGTGSLDVDSDLAITAPAISGESLFSYAINASNDTLSVATAPAGGDINSRAAIGSSLTLSAADVDFAGNVVLPSGSVTLHQTGDVTDAIAGDDLLLREQAVIDVSGVSETFGIETVYSDGGRVMLIADTGDVDIRNNTTIDVSPGLAEGESGMFSIVALGSEDSGMNPVGGLTSIDDAAGLAATGEGGDFELATASLRVGTVSDDTVYTALSGLLGDRFSATRSVRLRQQNISHEQGLTTRVHHLTLVSDEGSVSINGTIDATGQGLGTVREDGGAVVLSAGDGISIGDSDGANDAVMILLNGTVDSSSGNPFTGTRGGKLELVALDADGDDLAGTVDLVTIESDAVIDVSGGADPTDAVLDDVFRADHDLGGEVLVRTRVLNVATPSIPANVLTDSNIIGASRKDLVLTLDRNDLAADPLADGVIDSADISTMQSELDSFMADAFTDIGSDVNGFTIRPGLALDYDGTVTIDDEWNFYGYPGRNDPGLPPVAASGQWYYNDGSLTDDVAGSLSLRATGSIVMNASITDSVFDEPAFFVFPLLEDRIGSDRDSWSMNIVAGADIASANIRATASNIELIPANPGLAPLTGLSDGSLALANGSVIRTGTSDITVATAGDIDLGEGAIYTTGYDQGLSDDINALLATFGGDVTTAKYRFNEFLGGGQMFPIDGGDLVIASGGDIVAASVPDLPTEWLPRVSEPEASSLDNGTISWSTVGGAVPAHWGVAIQRFDGVGALGGGSVALSTSGDVRNVAVAIPTVGRSVAGAAYAGSGFLEADETTEFSGGGLLDVSIAGSATDLQLVLGDGVGDIQLFDASTDAATTVSVYNGFSASVDLTSVGDVSLTGMRDLGTVDVVDSQGVVNGEPASFFNNLFYTYTDDAEVNLEVLSGALQITGLREGFEVLGNAVAPSFSAVSLTGDLELATDLKLFPSSTGQLSLIAYDDVLGTFDELEIRVLGYNRNLLPSVQASSFNGQAVDINAFITDVEVAPLHVGDLQPSIIVARNGDIRTDDVNGLMVLDSAEAIYLEAGRDIRNLTTFVQHNNTNDISSVIAGRDIVQPTI